jgi:transposase
MPNSELRFHCSPLRFSDQKKAIVAVEHSILTASWHMLTNDADYADLGGDYFARLDPELAMRRIVRQANALGFTVHFNPIQAA